VIMSGWNDRGLMILGLVISLEMLISMELLLPVYIKDTTGSILLVGTLYSINGLVGLLIRIPSGAFSDRFGRKPFILFSGAMKAVGAFILSISNRLSHLTSAFIFRSVGLGVEEPAYFALISERSEAVRLGLTFGILLTLQKLPQAAGPVLTGFLSDVLDIRVLFLLNSALCVIATVVMFLSLKEEKKAAASTGLGLDVLRGLDRNVLIFFVAFLIHFMARASFVPFFTVFAEGKGLTLTQLGFILSLGHTVGIFSRVASGWFADRIGSKKVLLYTGVVRAIAFFAIPYAVGFPQLALVFIPYYSTMAAPPRNVMLSRISDESTYGKIFGAMATMRDLGDIIGAFALGIVAQQISLQASFVCMTALEVVFVALLLLVKERR